MIKPYEEPEPGAAVALPCRTLTGLGVVAALVMVCTTWASEQPTPEGSGEVGVAANQSVALGPSDSQADWIAAHASPQAPQTDVQVPSGADSTRVIRHPRRGAVATPLGDGETPWYRTGIGALAIVLALVCTAYWLVRRWMPGVRTSDSGVLRVVGRTALTPKHNASLIQMGRRFVLVGVAPDRVEMLVEVSAPDEVAELSARIGTQALSEAKAFDRLLASETVDYGAAKEQEAPARRPHGSQPEGKSGPLTDLLHRLRALSATGGSG